MCALINAIHLQNNNQFVIAPLVETALLHTPSDLRIVPESLFSHNVMQSDEKFLACAPANNIYSQSRILVGYVVTLAPNQIDFFNTRRDGEERKKNCRKKTVIEIAKVIARNAQEEEKTKDASDTL